MRRTTTRVATVLVAAAITAGAAPATSVAQQMPPVEPLPVTGRHLDGSVAEALRPGGSPPGADLPDCRPAPEHPRPVILVHGVTGNRQQNWVNAAAYLAGRGFCVYTMTYGALPLPGPLGGLGGLAPMAVIDRQMAETVDAVRARTGAAQVDLVAHSMGTVVTNSYVTLHGGARNVHTVVNLAGVMGGQSDPGGVLRGAVEAVAASGSAAPVIGGRPAVLDILEGSPRIDALNAGGSPYAHDVEYTNIVSRTDETIRPFTRGLAEGPRARNIVLQDGCEVDRSDHGAVAAAPRALALLHNALAPVDPVPVPCVPVWPLVGPVSPPGGELSVALPAPPAES